LAQKKQPDADSAVPTVPKPVGAVFISYASQDAEAAKRIGDALRAAGIEVWFDQSELRGGDVWDQKIRQQILDCRLFVPIVSANTEARVEGYFRREWKLAVERTHDLSERVAFLVPIVLDSTPETKADVPDAFRHVQWTRLPDANAYPAFIEQIRRLTTPIPSSALPTAMAPAERGTARKATTTDGPRRVARVALWTLCGLVALGLACFVADRFWLSKRTAAENPVAAVAPAATPALPAVPEKSVAVLPFVDMSEKKDQEYFSDGLSEELIDLLTKVPQLRVPARTSSFYFKGKQTTTAEISRALSVANILEGSVRKSGNTLRITAQLIRADTGYHLWSETYDRQFGDIFKIQDEIADAVVKALKISLLESATTRPPPTTSPEAYTLYAQARALILHSNPADAAKAADYLKRAIEIDPKYAPAWAELTQARTFQYEMGALSFEQAREEASRSARRAVDLDPDLAAAHLSMARVYNFFEWNWAAAGAEIQRARQLDPGDANALRWAGVYAWVMGHAKEASDLFQQAVDLDPLNGANYSMLGAAQFSSGEYAGADHAWSKAVELAPPHGFGANEGHAQVLLATGQATAALTEFEQFEDEGDREWGKALAYFALGRKTESDTALMNLEKNFGQTHAYSIAQVHAYRREIDQALEWLDHAYRLHAAELAQIKADSYLTPLRSDPRYQAMLRKMNLPE
jgi:TolB-like protein/Tfp pilus assembly protein PilF